ncbi:MAG: hypothetical protein JNL18_07955 [Planctomycetaceae bacterium]|nr:hypothetical protein [Planctomycetaceae bacterium]
MNTDHDWIDHAVKLLDLDIERMPDAAAKQIADTLIQKYADGDSRLPLWEAIADCASCRRDNGWREIGVFVGDLKCILLTERDGVGGYCIPSGNQLVAILAECPGFEFYVTDEICSYVLCYNHHDYLIGAGAASKWVAILCDE